MYVDWDVLRIVEVIEHKIWLSAPLLVNVKQGASLSQVRSLQCSVIGACISHQLVLLGLLGMSNNAAIVADWPPWITFGKEKYRLGVDKKAAFLDTVNSS